MNEEHNKTKQKMHTFIINLIFSELFKKYISQTYLKKMYIIELIMSEI